MIYLQPCIVCSAAGEGPQQASGLSGGAGPAQKSFFLQGDRLEPAGQEEAQAAIQTSCGML